jgi:hypothetical protein
MIVSDARQIPRVAVSTSLLRNLRLAPHFLVVDISFLVDIRW